MAKQEPNGDAILPREGFVRVGQIAQMLSIGRSTWWAGVKAGRFPPGLLLGPRTRVWRAADIRRLIETGDWRSADDDHT